VLFFFVHPQAVLVPAVVVVVYYPAVAADFTWTDCYIKAPF